ncbi:MAG TPA: hypothetical protein PLL10_10460 [Elusimicrobiales bacterium]|nr:hypothetical protein [Elusimicrobiales bacterium]
MTKEKIRTFVRISVNDLLNDSPARRELAKMLVAECIAKQGVKTPQEVEAGFVDIIHYFSE